jgi:3-oxoacyl-[acyl-carrier protein] reductase
LGSDISISCRHDAQAAAGVINGYRAVGIAPLAFCRVPISDLHRNDLASKAAADLAALHRPCLAFVPGMKSGFGKVIVISSGVAWEPDAPDLAAHGVGKAAVGAYTRYATFEPASGAVAVNSLQLGMVKKAGSSVVPAPACCVLAAATPAGHIATPEDIVGVVAPLAQPGCGWINGTTVLVAGGMNYPMNLVAVLSSTEHDPDEAS